MRKVYLSGIMGAVTALLFVGMTNTVLAADFFEGFEHSGLFDDGNGVIHTSPGLSTFPEEANYAPGIDASKGHFLARLSVQPTADVNGDGDPACAPGSHDCFGPFTRWGNAYNVRTGIPMKQGGSVTATDIYLDVSFAATHSDYRFDWSSALTDSQHSFLQDYVFNAGTGNPSQPVACHSGSGGYFVIAASTNATRSGAYPQNPAKMPQCIATSGWYTFQHVFRSDNSHNLEVDMSISNAENQVVASWVLHPTCMAPQSTPEGLCTDGAPLPFSAVGANRYGWFVIQEIDNLGVDNILLTQVRNSEGHGDGHGDSGH